MDTNETTVIFIGTGSLLPAPDNDAPYFVINGHIMVDTGLGGVHRMRAWIPNPGIIDYLLITHCHPDHTRGLPSLLGMRQALPFYGKEVRPLTIVGPAGRLEIIYELTKRYMEAPSDTEFAELIPLHPGEGLDTVMFSLTTCASNHSEPGLVYRFRDKQTGKEIGMTGDTAPDPAIAEHLKGVDLLIHDSNLGTTSAADRTNPPHSGARDAARCAVAAGVGRLALIHCDDHQASADAAGEIFENSFWPEIGEEIIV